MNNNPVIEGKKALLLDMNGTFMFGEDRFAYSEDFSLYYESIGGTLPNEQLNTIVRSAYEYLDTCYHDESYQHCFPTVGSAILAVVTEALSTDETDKIIATFAYHELGYIPDEYAQCLHQLQQRFMLAAIIDIWSPKKMWLKEFERAGIASLFTAVSFSSDHGLVKPSAKPFERVLEQLEITASDALVVGDSPQRDLGGARHCGIDCILVGGAEDPAALKSFNNLLELCDAI